MEKKLDMITVTVGIPAFNEGQNIPNLLNSILKQEQRSYHLDKIIVISDGSNDDTDKKVVKISQQNPNIILVNDHQRIGKLKRLMQLYKISESDVVVQFDADVVLGDRLVIEKLVREFSNKLVAIVSGNYKPINDSSFSGKVFIKWESIWHQLRKDLNNGNSIRNCLSSILAIRSDFAKHIKFQPQFYTNGQFIYCYAKQKKYEFRYVDDAIIYFRTPSSIKEYFSQNIRSSNERLKLAKFFGNWVDDLYKIPLTTLAYVLITNFLQSPVYSSLGAVFFLIPRLYPQKKKNFTGTWNPLKSTKKGIAIVS